MESSSCKWNPQSLAYQIRLELYQVMWNNSFHLALHLERFVCIPNGPKCLIIAYLLPISTLFIKMEFDLDLLVDNTSHLLMRIGTDEINLRQLGSPSLNLGEEILKRDPAKIYTAFCSLFPAKETRIMDHRKRQLPAPSLNVLQQTADLSLGFSWTINSIEESENTQPYQHQTAKIGNKQKQICLFWPFPVALHNTFFHLWPTQHNCRSELEGFSSESPGSKRSWHPCPTVNWPNMLQWSAYLQINKWDFWF